MLAKDLIQILENQRYLVVGKTNQDLDITNKDSVIKVLKQENPDSAPKYGADWKTKHPPY